MIVTLPLDKLELIGRGCIFLHLRSMLNHESKQMAVNNYIADSLYAMQRGQALKHRMSDVFERAERKPDNRTAADVREYMLKKLNGGG